MTEEEKIAAKDYFLDLVASGMSARTACKEDGVPNFTTVWRWMKNDDDFRDKYQVAMELRSQRIDDDIDDVINDMRMGNMDAQQARVVIDTYKWRMAKLYPKFYGENKQIEVQHKANSFIDELKLVAEKVEEQKQLQANTIEGDVIDVSDD